MKKYLSDNGVKTLLVIAFTVLVAAFIAGGYYVLFRPYWGEEDITELVETIIRDAPQPRVTNVLVSDEAENETAVLRHLRVQGDLDESGTGQLIKVKQLEDGQNIFKHSTSLDAFVVSEDGGTTYTKVGGGIEPNLTLVHPKGLQPEWYSGVYCLNIEDVESTPLYFAVPPEDGGDFWYDYGDDAFLIEVVWYGTGGGGADSVLISAYDEAGPREWTAHLTSDLGGWQTTIVPFDETFQADMKFLLHTDGTHGVTDFYSMAEWVDVYITNNGTVSHSNEQAKYGSTSVKFPDGSASDYLEVSYDAQLNIPVDKDWTIDFFVYLSDHTHANNAIFGRNNQEWLSMVVNDGVADGTITVYASIDNSGAWDIDFDSVAKLTSGAWHHIALVRDIGAETLDLYIDGSWDSSAGLDDGDGIEYGTDPEGDGYSFFLGKGANSFIGNMYLEQFRFRIDIIDPEPPSSFPPIFEGVNFNGAYSTPSGDADIKFHSDDEDELQIQSVRLLSPQSPAYLFWKTTEGLESAQPGYKSFIIPADDEAEYDCEDIAGYDAHTFLFVLYELAYAYIPESKCFRDDVTLHVIANGGDWVYFYPDPGEIIYFEGYPLSTGYGLTAGGSGRSVTLQKYSNLGWVVVGLDGTWSSSAP